MAHSTTARLRHQIFRLNQQGQPDLDFGLGEILPPEDLALILTEEDRHAVFGTGMRARSTPVLASLRVRGIHLTRRRPGPASHFCHKQWITSRHTCTSGE